MKKQLVYIGILFVSVSSCKEPETIERFPNLNLPETAFDYNAYANSIIPNSSLLKIQDNTPIENPISDWGATLGRVMFYDQNFSQNRKISCSSCHIQEFAFSDTAKLSRGLNGEFTGRHSMALLNSRFYFSGRFFWDERAETLEDQVLMPIQDQVEMNLSLDSLLARMRTTDYYPLLFEKAFGTDSITEERTALALAQFVRSIVSFNSRFDEGLKLHEMNPNVPFSNFSDEENIGKEIFFNHEVISCAKCHFTEALIGDNPRNNGVVNGDFGAFSTYGDPQLAGAFKVPSLKGIADRAPYMHDGSLATLEDVVEHYNSQLDNSNDKLDRHLVAPNGEALKMNLTEGDKRALVAFLKTLSDEEIKTHPMYSNPFKLD